MSADLTREELLAAYPAWEPHDSIPEYPGWCLVLRGSRETLGRVVAMAPNLAASREPYRDMARHLGALEAEYLPKIEEAARAAQRS